MSQRRGGFRRKTRHKLKKNHSDKGKISIKKYLQKFNEGELVQLSAEPAIQKGMYHPRFHSKNAKIIRQIGKCYEVMIKDGNMYKKLIVHPVHLKPWQK